MSALLRKELAALWPLFLVACVVFSGDVLYRPLTELLDQSTWEDIASYLRAGEGAGFGWIAIPLVVSVAYAAFPREHDEGTIALLRALPVRPSSIFIAKVLAGMAVITAALSLLTVTDGLQGSLNDESIRGGHWRDSLALSHLGMQVVFAFIVYAHGLLASVLRLFGLLPYALLLMLGSILENLFPPAAWINPASLLDARYDGTALVVPWGPLAVHLALALLALLAAALAWLGPGDRVSKGFERARATILGKLAIGCGGALTLLVLLVLAVLAVDRDDAPEETEDEPRAAPSLETAEARTERFVYTYPVSHRARAERLMGGADAMHAELRRLLDADPGPVLIADLTEVSADHLGIASWTHIRVGIVQEDDFTRLRRTFAHETAHALQQRISQRGTGRHGRAMRFFSEGSAEWLAYEVVPGPEARRRARLIGAVTWARHRMRPEDLMDDDRLRARYDTTLVYPLGELWTEALVSRCGERAVGAALRESGGELASGVAPRVLWDELLGRIGCDLEAVDAAFVASARALVEEHAEEVAEIPRLSGGVTSREGGRLTIEARLDRDLPARDLPARDQPDLASTRWELYARIRSGPEASDTQVMTLRGTRDGPRRVRFEVPTALVPSARFELAFGVRRGDAEWAFFERWQSARR